MDISTTVVIELMKAAGVVTDREAQTANFDRQPDTSIYPNWTQARPVNLSSGLYLSLVGPADEERRRQTNTVIPASRAITEMVDGAIAVLNRQFAEPVVSREIVRDGEHDLYSVTLGHPPETRRRELVTLSIRRDAVGELLAKLQQ